MLVTVEIDDDLFVAAAHLAAARHVSLDALVEEVLLPAVGPRLPSTGDGLTLPSADGGEFPACFPLPSGGAMLEYVEATEIAARAAPGSSYP